MSTKIVLVVDKYMLYLLKSFVAHEKNSLMLHKY